MSARSIRWSGARGCGLLVGLAILTALTLAGGWVVTIRPLHKAVETRETLAELYGAQDGYTPPADGAVPAERMEVFLGVRERLAESCARLTESISAIDYMEEQGISNVSQVDFRNYEHELVLERT